MEREGRMVEEEGEELDTFGREWEKEEYKEENECG